MNDIYSNYMILDLQVVLNLQLGLKVVIKMSNIPIIYRFDQIKDKKKAPKGERDRSMPAHVGTTIQHNHPRAVNFVGELI